MLLRTSLNEEFWNSEFSNILRNAEEAVFLFFVFGFFFENKETKKRKRRELDIWSSIFSQHKQNGGKWLVLGLNVLKVEVFLNLHVLSGHDKS